MNRRFKLLVLVLLTAVLCLSAAIASLAFSGFGGKTVQQNPETPSAGPSVSLFVGQNGLWGARNANGRVLIEPAWYYLRLMSDTVLIARRNDGKTDSFGLIRSSDGEQLVPFLYSSFEMRAPDLWVASMKENGQMKYHLYHEDGTRWINASWDSVLLSGNTLTAIRGNSSYTGTLSKTDRRIIWTEIHEEYPVSLYPLIMDLSEAKLRHLPDAGTLRQIGQAAADYLEYLFITGSKPDASRISTEQANEILIADRYQNCQFQKAEISRISVRETNGFPAYLVQIQVQYRAPKTEDETETVRTAILLTLSRNAAGDYTYSGCSDVRLDAAGDALR